MRIFETCSHADINNRNEMLVHVHVDRQVIMSCDIMCVTTTVMKRMSDRMR